MTAGLRQYLMLAGIGVAGGFALIVALLGPGELMKRASAVVSPGEAPRTLADIPGGASAPEGKQTADKPAVEKPADGGGRQAALPPAENVGKQDGKEGPKPGAPVAEEAPSLDIVRVEPSGDAVIAGRAAPQAEIEILRDNKPIARAKADGNGQFAIVPPTLPAGNSEISYRAVAPDGKETRGRESVAIVVAENRATKPLVAVSTPDKPTVVLSQPDTPAAASPEQKADEARTVLAGKAEPKSGERPQQTQQGKPQEKQRLSALPEPKAGGGDKGAPVKVVTIDAQEGGRLDVSGVSKPGATLRLYLNDTLVASGKAGPDGKLAFTIGRGVRPGGYQVRIDQVEPDTGKVENRAQVAFAFPESAAPKLAAREASPAAVPPPPLPAKPDSDRRQTGALGERNPSAREGNAVAGTSPPPAPAAEVRAANRQAEAAGNGSPAPKPEAQRQASRAESAPENERQAVARPDKTEPPSVATAPRPATPEPETQAPDAGKRMAETATPKPSASGPDRALAQRPLASDKPSDTPATPESRESSSLAAATPKPSAGSQGEPASPAPRRSEPTDGMKADAPGPGATASVTPEPMPADKPGTVFVPEISTARIARGDNLWQISRRTYGHGLRYTVIFDANKEQIRDPDLIYPGQIFVLPKDEAGAKRG